jgi:hypothetical protein
MKMISCKLAAVVLLGSYVRLALGAAEPAISPQQGQKGAEEAGSRFLLPQESWGLETNGVSLGISVLRNYGEIPRAMTICTPLLKNSRTNNANRGNGLLQLFVPPPRSCYRLELLQADGSPLPKTAMGKSMWKPVTDPLMDRMGVNTAAGYSSASLMGDFPDQPHFRFNPLDYFQVKKPGVYRLRLEMRVIWITNGWSGDLRSTKNLPIVNIPPVEIQIELP